MEQKLGWNNGRPADRTGMMSIVRLTINIQIWKFSPSKDDVPLLDPTRSDALENEVGHTVVATGITLMDVA